MKFENERHKERLGSSVFSTIEVYTKLLPFIKLWRKAHSKERLYICCTDVKGAYDTIPHAKCLSILEDNIFNHPEYMIMKHAIIRPYMGKLSTKFERSACLPGQFPQIEQMAGQLSSKFSKSVINDQVVHQYIDRAQILTLLRSHIEMNVISWA